LFTEEINFPAATDGFQLIFKPSEFFTRGLMKRVFMVLHEVMHEVLNHCRVGYAFQRAGKITVAGKSLPYVPMFANIVQDLCINATLIACKWGEFDPAWLFDKDLYADQTEWVELYFRLWKKHPPGKSPRPGPGKGTGAPGTGTPTPGPSYPEPGKGFDEHMEPAESTGKDAHEAPERSEAAWEMAVNTAMEIQRAHGKLPAAMEMFFDRILRPVVDWTEHVRGELARHTNAGAYSWEKLDRRLVARGIGAPSMTGYGADVIVIGTDTSGSIFADKTLLERFIGETAGILEDVNPREVHWVECDAAVQRSVILHDMDDLRAIIGTIKGGGGTSFVPVFNYIEENQLTPDALIYLTDLAGVFPGQEPDYPVIWGAICEGEAPYGKIVRIPVNRE
jgi:predicted metal-dependent peptidase